MTTVDVEDEKRLWLTVVLQAQRDAEGRGEAEKDARLRRLAVRWLTTLSRSFMMVCSLAGMDRQTTLRLQKQERERWKP